MCKYGYSGANCQTIVTNTKFTVTTQLIVNCVDQDTVICLKYKSLNLCSDSYTINGQTINMYCPKTCGLCGTNTTNTTPACVDADGNCPVYSVIGYCGRLPDPYVCRKSCQLC